MFLIVFMLLPPFASYLTPIHSPPCPPFGPTCFSMGGVRQPGLCSVAGPPKICTEKKASLSPSTHQTRKMPWGWTRKPWWRRFKTWNILNSPIRSCTAKKQDQLSEHPMTKNSRDGVCMAWRCFNASNWSQIPSLHLSAMRIKKETPCVTGFPSYEDQKDFIRNYVIHWFMLKSAPLTYSWIWKKKTATFRDLMVRIWTWELCVEERGPWRLHRLSQNIHFWNQKCSKCSHFWVLLNTYGFKNKCTIWRNDFWCGLSTHTTTALFSANIFGPPQAHHMDYGFPLRALRGPETNLSGSLLRNSMIHCSDWCEIN